MSGSASFVALDATLDGEPGAEAPYAWLVARVCDEFGCTPSQAMAEIEDTPYPLLWDVMELRAYARTKRQLEDPNAKKDDMPTGPMADLVWKIKDDRFARARGMGKYRPAKPPAS